MEAICEKVIRFEGNQIEMLIGVQIQNLKEKVKKEVSNFNF